MSNLQMSVGLNCFISYTYEILNIHILISLDPSPWWVRVSGEAIANMLVGEGSDGHIRSE